MASRTTPDCNEPTTALRERSPGRLREDLERLMAAYERDIERDPRDVLVGLAAYVDCARRLGIDPVELFDTTSARRSPRMRELSTTFVRRDDVTLEAFGWRLEDRPDGPCYRPDSAGSRHQLHARNRGIS